MSGGCSRHPGTEPSGVETLSGGGPVTDGDPPGPGYVEGSVPSRGVCVPCRLPFVPYIETVRPLPPGVISLFRRVAFVDFYDLFCIFRNGHSPENKPIYSGSYSPVRISTVECPSLKFTEKGYTFPRDPRSPLILI